MKRIFTISGLVLFCFFFINSAFAQNIAVKGRVTDATTGESLIGVSVVVRGTTNGTQTDVNGAYSLAAPSTATLVFTYIGYANQEVAVNGRNTIDVKLVLSSNELQQVVVIGYGTQRKIDVSGAIATVKGEDLASQPDANPISALQGKVAGVQITNSGTPGSAPQISIRGLGTVYGSTNPLYVVDGIFMSDISFLNSNDVESMSILKDASSEAIYGIKAANGVIIITTKKGKGAPVVRYSGYAGFQTVSNFPKLANATEYATLSNEVSLYNGGAPNPLFTNPSSLGQGNSWFNVILHNAFVQSHNISISGGTDKSTYNFSAGYLQQDGNIEYNAYNKITVHMQQDAQVYKFLSIGYNALLEGDQSHDIPGDIMYKAYTAAPVVPVRYASGAYGDPADYGIGLNTNNPQAELDFFHQHTKNYRFNGNVHADVNITNYLTFHTDIGGDFEQQEIANYLPIYIATTNQRNISHSSLSLQNNDIRNWQWENYLKFEKVIAKDHNVTLLVGNTVLSNKTYNESGSALDVPNVPDNNYLSLGDPNSTKVTDNGTLITQTSYFARLNYAYKDLYALNASVRDDNASQFTPSKRQGIFPSIGAAWNISNEDFMKNQSIFNTLKLRGSWGVLGNGSVPSNLTQLTINNSFVSNLGGGTTVQNGQGITTLVPPTLFWEKTVGTDIGLETGFLNNALTFEFDYYNRKTENAIFDAPILGSLGLTSVNGAQSILANQANIQNRGFELSAGWRGHVGSDFSYSINANFSINNNKVLTVSSGSNPIYGGGNAAPGGAFATETVAGKPIGEFFGYKVVGIFQNATQVANSKQPNAKPGDFIFQDTNGDGVISGLDRVDLGNPNAKYLYGFNTKFNYMHFDLAIDFQGVANVSIYDAIEGLRYGGENYTQNFYDSRWHGDGTSNTNPSVNIGSTSNSVPNSWFVRDGSYLRVRNLQLGYNLPGSVMSKIGIRSIRIFASAQNPLTFSKYKGFSPEIQAQTNGVNQNTGTNQGIDTGVVPIYATYNFGLNVTF